MEKSNVALLERPTQTPFADAQSAGSLLVNQVEQFLREQSELRPGLLPWISASAVGPIARVQQSSRLEADGIMKERVQQLCEGHDEDVPNPVDPLSTATRVVQAEKLYGKESQKYRDAYEGLRTDSLRLLMEGNSKRAAEYFPEIEQEFVEEKDDFYFKGYSLKQMVRGGLSPMAHEEEREYRVGEYAEEATYGAVRKLGSLAMHGMVAGKAKVVGPLPDVHVVTVSRCADWAINNYKRKSKAGTGGYVPEIEKVMIRGMRFATNGNRYQEQLAVPGMHYSQKVFDEFYRRKNMLAPGKSMSKKEGRATHMINMNGEGAIAVLAELDTIASELTGLRIFKGEVIREDQPKDYAAIPAESAARQQKLEKDSYVLTDYLIGLERKGMDHWAAQGPVGLRVKQLLFESVKQNPTRAAIVFDDETALLLSQANDMGAARNFAGMLNLQNQAFQQAPPIEFCGAGCGIEEVDADSEEGQSYKKLLEAKDDDVISKDTMRPCRSCGKMTVVYAHDVKRVNKACTNPKCNVKEINNH